MLVLGRHVNQAICIGDDIKVIVIRIKGDDVRLGIEAPSTVRVDREEIKKVRDGGKDEKRRR